MPFCMRSPAISRPLPLDIALSYCPQEALPQPKPTPIAHLQGITYRPVYAVDSQVSTLFTEGTEKGRVAYLCIFLTI